MSDPAAFRTIKLFDLAMAPPYMQEVIRPIALVHLGKAGGRAIWELTVGSYDYDDSIKIWAFHGWLRQRGAYHGEEVLIQMDDLEKPLDSQIGLMDI